MFPAMTSSVLSPKVSTFFYRHDSEFDDRNFQIHGRTLFSLIVLFSTLLLVAVFFLYLRRICHLGFTNPHTPPPPRFVGDGGLDPAAIRGLPVVSCNREPGPAAVEERECCICLGAFEDGDKVKVLPPCRHYYHCECVDRWLRAESSCPLCRARLRVDSAVTVVTQ